MEQLAAELENLITQHRQGNLSYIGNPIEQSFFDGNQFISKEIYFLALELLRLALEETDIRCRNYVFQRIVKPIVMHLSPGFVIDAELYALMLRDSIPNVELRMGEVLQYLPQGNLKHALEKRHERTPGELYFWKFTIDDNTKATAHVTGPLATHLASSGASASATRVTSFGSSSPATRVSSFGSSSLATRVPSFGSSSLATRVPSFGSSSLATPATGPRKGEGNPSRTLHFAPFPPFTSRVGIADAIMNATGISNNDIEQLTIRHESKPIPTYAMALLSGTGMQVPCRATLTKLMRSELEKIQGVIRAQLSKAKVFSLCADTATTKGMRDSFLGITAHFWHPEYGVRCYATQMATVNVRHTASNIRQLLLNHILDMRLPERNAFRIVTDGARNMQAAFVNPFYPQNIEDEGNLVEEDIVVADPAYGDIERLERMYNGEIIPEAEIPAFQVASNTYCAAHRLQLVVKDVFESSGWFKNTRERIFVSLGKFSKSHTATKSLYIATGSRLLFPANTRWSSIHIAYSRVLEILGPLNSICKENKWPLISEGDAENMRVTCSYLELFRNFTTALQSEKHPTSSVLYVGIFSLIKKIEENQLSATISSNLVTRTKERFQDVLLSGQENSDPFYLAAAFLDPQMALCSVLSGKERNAKWCILKLAEHFGVCGTDGEPEQITPPGSQNELTASQNSATANQPATFSASQLIGFEVESELPSQLPQSMELESQINRFFAHRKKPAFYETTSNLFWKCYHRGFPLVDCVARIVLSSPATSASVERLFSQMTINTTGHKSSTSAELAEMRSLISFNQALL